jgi:prepilin-type N-terminal cleavage/methylation domain-containing protein
MIMIPKTRKNQRRGFTLIELLVAITIIVALAAMSFAGVNAAMKKARKLEGETAANAIRSAVEGFYSEYNRLPNISGNEVRTDSGEGVQLLRVLLAEEKEDNTRQVPLLSAKEGKSKKGGLIYGSGSSAGVEGMYDPFGNPFTVVLNTDYAEALTFSVGGKTYTLRGQNVAVYSAGGDKELGTSDDVKTF